MGRCAAWLSLAAVLVVGVDLAHKAIALADRGDVVVSHPRSAFYAIGVALASTLWSGAILLTRSTSIAVCGGILVGGAAGNLVSLVLWPGVDGVPNPLVAGEVAFNLADAAVVLGLGLVLATPAAFGARNRGRLREPVRLSRS